MTRQLKFSVGLLCLAAATALAANTSAPAAKAAAPAAAKPASAAAAAAPSLPGLTAAQIVERNVQARGGLDAWHAVTSMTLTGRMEAGGSANPELPFVMKMKRPHKSRLEIRFNDKTAVQVYDGANGWKLRPFLDREQVEPYSAAEAKQAAAWDEMDGPLVDYEKKGTRVALAGTESVDGHDCYQLKLTLKDGQVRNVWVDGKTFMERKMDGEPRRIDGRLHPVSIYVRDFKKQGAVSVASVLETQVEGVNAKPHKLMVEAVALNEAMDDALFAKPQRASAASARK